MSTTPTGPAMHPDGPTMPRSLRALLRVEGAAALALATAGYAALGHGWLLFALLLFLPDLSMIGYAAGPRVGAATYNAAHTYAAPAIVGAVGWAAAAPTLLAVALVWTAHIGLDRLLGYGLKLPSGFRDTHLGTIGRG